MINKKEGRYVSRPSLLFYRTLCYKGTFVLFVTFILVS